jgi:chitin synthase
VIESDLGAVIQDSHSQVDVEILADAADVNRLYEDSLENLKNRKPVDRKITKPTVVEMEQNAKDYYASVRTNVSFHYISEAHH